MSGSRTHYETLGVVPTDSVDRIRNAYRALAREYHPDTGRTPDAHRMAAINAAWHELSDPARRVRYDAGLRLSRPSPTPPPRRDVDLDIPLVGPRGPRRWPAVGLMMVVAMAVIFVFTAYALQPPESPPADPNQPLAVGQCVVVRNGPYVWPAPCDRARFGRVVMAMPESSSTCATGTEGYFERSTGRLICVDVGG